MSVTYTSQFSSSFTCAFFFFLLGDEAPLSVCAREEDDFLRCYDFGGDVGSFGGFEKSLVKKFPPVDACDLSLLRVDEGCWNWDWES
jgi:hypothetical protein